MRKWWKTNNRTSQPTSRAWPRAEFTFAEYENFLSSSTNYALFDPEEFFEFLRETKEDHEVVVYDDGYLLRLHAPKNGVYQCVSIDQGIDHELWRAKNLIGYTDEERKAMFGLPEDERRQSAFAARMRHGGFKVSDAKLSEVYANLKADGKISNPRIAVPHLAF